MWKLRQRSHDLAKARKSVIVEPGSELSTDKIYSIRLALHHITDIKGKGRDMLVRLKKKSPSRNASPFQNSTHLG